LHFEPIIYNSKLLDSKCFTSLVLDAFLKPIEKHGFFIEELTIVSFVYRNDSKLTFQTNSSIARLILSPSRRGKGGGHKQHKIKNNDSKNNRSAKKQIR
jgi:hypothetical protein